MISLPRLRAGFALWVATLMLISSLAASSARAQGLSLIRDAEIENMIRAYSEPIFEAAGLQPDHVRIHLVNSPDINAFVAGGQRIFVFTGMLLQAREPSEVIGILAHETGHITGGHLARSQDAIQNATTIAILTMLLGAAAIAAGGGDAGAAILAGGSDAATRSFLSYSRTQEAAADQAALQLMTATGQSAHGLINMFELLGDQEALLTDNKDPYVRSHPLTQDRIESLRLGAEASPYWLKPDRPEYVEMLRRSQAKLIGFLVPPQRVLQRFPPRDQSLYARYARTVAYHRDALTELALAEIDGLVEDYPRDPYFRELKGQILFESGRIAEAAAPYRKAVELAPNEPLLRVALGQTLVALENEAAAKEAIGHLAWANHQEPGNAFSWLQLSIAHNRLGQQGQANLASAEYYAMQGKARETIITARRAMDGLEKNSPSWLRANDLMTIARNAAEDQARRRGRKPPEIEPPDQEPPDQAPEETMPAPDESQTSEIEKS